jgi:hypothetical protein
MHQHALVNDQNRIPLLEIEPDVFCFIVGFEKVELHGICRKRQLLAKSDAHLLTGRTDQKAILVRKGSIVDLNLTTVFGSLLVVIIRYKIDVLTHGKKHKEKYPNKKEDEKENKPFAPVYFHN